MAPSGFDKKSIDQTTQALVVISHEEHEIHLGDGFIYNDNDTDVDIAVPKIYRITTPDTTRWSHLVIEVTADAAGTLEFSEDPTILAAGTAGTTYNLDRNSSTASTLLVKYDATTQAPNNDGTLIWSDKIGQAGHPTTTFGGTTATVVEIILKQNEDYIVKFTTVADNNALHVRFIWFEHTNEN